MCLASLRCKTPADDSAYVEGQMQAALAGIGWALNEYIFDDNGVLENAGFLDYRFSLPRISP